MVLSKTQEKEEEQEQEQKEKEKEQKEKEQEEIDDKIQAISYWFIIKIELNSFYFVLHQ